MSKVSALASAQAVLEKAGRPMQANVLAKVCARQGKFSGSYVRGVAEQIYKAIRSQGKSCPFTLVSRGVFGLRKKNSYSPINESIYTDASRRVAAIIGPNASMTLRNICRKFHWNKSRAEQIIEVGITFGILTRYHDGRVYTSQPSCFPPNTKVMTNIGVKNIQDLVSNKSKGYIIEGNKMVVSKNSPSSTLSLRLEDISISTFKNSKGTRIIEYSGPEDVIIRRK